MPHNLQHRDVTIVRDDATGKEILEIEVRGKRGVGYCKGMLAAVDYYRRLSKRATPESTAAREAAEKRASRLPKYPQPTDPVFPGNRSAHAYSLRHTYNCVRLMEGADIYHGPLALLPSETLTGSPLRALAARLFGVLAPSAPKKRSFRSGLRPEGTFVPRLMLPA